MEGREGSEGQRGGEGRSKWNRGGAQELLADEGGKFVLGPRVPSYATADGAGLPTHPGPV